MFKIKAKNIVSAKFATQTFRDNKGLNLDLLLLSDAEMEPFIQQHYSRKVIKKIPHLLLKQFDMN